MQNVELDTNNNLTNFFMDFKDKKLSYRTHIMPQLRTQYIEGMYSTFVTLKSRLGITRGTIW